MSTQYVIAPGQLTIQGCVEQPGTLLETSYSGLETLTFSFRGRPSNIFDLQQQLAYFTVPPIVGNWANFRIVAAKISENDGVWARLACTAKGLRGDPPQPTYRWSKNQQSISGAEYRGVQYSALYYLSPMCEITRVQLVQNGFTTLPQPDPPEFGDEAKVQLLTQSGYEDVTMPGALRSCLDFRYQQTGIYWEIEEVWGVTIPQPGEGTEFTFPTWPIDPDTGKPGVIRGYSWGPNFTTKLFS